MTEAPPPVLYLFIYLFFILAVLGLHCSAQASLVAAHGLSGGMWDLVP